MVRELAVHADEKMDGESRTASLYTALVQGRGTPLYSLEGSVMGERFGASARGIFCALGAMGRRFCAAPQLHR